MIIENLNKYSEEQIASLECNDNLIRLIIQEQPDRHKLELLKRYAIKENTAIQLCLCAVDNNLVNFDIFECLSENVVVLESYNRKSTLVSIAGISIFGNLKELVISDLYDSKLNLEELVSLKYLQSFSLKFNCNLHNSQYDAINRLYSLKKLEVKGLNSILLDKLPNMESLICHNLKDGTQLGYKMPNLKSIFINKSQQIRDLNFLLDMKIIQCICLDGLSNLSLMPDLVSLSNLRRIGICNMKRLEQIPMLNYELESLDVEKNTPLLGVDSFRYVTPINLPNLKWIRINLGNDTKSNMILNRFNNICKTTRW